MPDWHVWHAGHVATQVPLEQHWLIEAQETHLLVLPLHLPEPLREAEVGNHFFQDVSDCPRGIGRKCFLRQTTPLGEHAGAQF